MKSSVPWLFIATLFLTTSAINLRKRQDGVKPRVVSLDLQRNHIPDPTAHDRARLKRDNDSSVEVKITNMVRVSTSTRVGSSPHTNMTLRKPYIPLRLI